MQCLFWRFSLVAIHGLGGNFLRCTTRVQDGHACEISSKSTELFALQARQKISWTSIDWKRIAQSSASYITLLMSSSHSVILLKTDAHRYLWSRAINHHVSCSCRWQNFRVQGISAFTFWQQLYHISSFNTFSLTPFLIVAKMSLPKRSAPYWSNPPFYFFDIQALWCPQCQSARMSKN